MLLLLIALVCAIVSLGSAGGQRQLLKAQQLAQEKAYAYEVQRHQVKYRELIEKYAAQYELDPAFVAAIIKTESDYDPYAKSNKGALGLMQFMPDSFEWIAPKFNIDKNNIAAIYEPENAIKMGCWLLNYITEQFDGDPVLTACAYHAGWGNVKGWLKNSAYSGDGKTLAIEKIPYDNTKNYARKVMNSYAIYQQHHY